MRRKLSKKPENQSWLEYYKSNKLENLSRTDLYQRHKKLHAGLKSEGVLDSLLPKRNMQKSKNRLDEYLEQKFSGVYRDELKFLNKDVYDILKFSGLISKIQKDPTSMPMREYLAKYDTFTKGELSLVNPSLLELLTDKNMDNMIPSGPSYNGKDVLIYALENYSMHTDDAIRKQDPKLADLLDNQRKYVQGLVDNSMKLFNDKYAGLTTKELYKDDINLFRRLKYANNLSKILKKEEYFGGDPLYYCKSKFDNISANELRDKAPDLYRRLEKYRLLGYVNKSIKVKKRESNLLSDSYDVDRDKEYLKYKILNSYRDK